MALADILTRVEADARAEVETIEAAARAQAELLLADARGTAAHERDQGIAQARRHAELEAETILANSRLSARDALLVRKRALIERTLAEAEARLFSMSDDEYAALIARKALTVARSGETVRFGSLDRQRLYGRLQPVLLPAGLVFSEEPAEAGRGVTLEGDRTKTVVSPASILESMSEELTAMVAAMLFGAESPGGVRPAGDATEDAVSRGRTAKDGRVSA